MATNSLDLTKLLPRRNLDKTLESLLKNLYNRHLSKDDAEPLYGFIGEQTVLAPGEVHIKEKTLDRQVNQLTPHIYAEHATEKFVFSWPDLIQKMVLQGVDVKALGDIFTTKSYNFAPPIDLDKFCNYNEYYWIGNWILKSPTLPYRDLGIPQLYNIEPYFATVNPTYLPEYYVIARGELSVTGNPQILDGLSDYITWPEWALANLWVHRQDAVAFLTAHAAAINFGDLVQATRPIIEYFNTLRLNTRQTDEGAPTDSPTATVKLLPKLRINQPPLFDIYDKAGKHAGFTSAIFYYKEGSQYPVDSELGRRVATTSGGDFVFEHSLVDPDTGELYFYSLFEPS